MALRRRAWPPYTRRAVNSAAMTVARVAMVTRTTPCPVMVGQRLFFAIPISHDRDARGRRDVTRKTPGRCRATPAQGPLCLPQQPRHDGQEQRKGHAQEEHGGEGDVDREAVTADHEVAGESAHEGDAPEYGEDDADEEDNGAHEDEDPAERLRVHASILGQLNAVVPRRGVVRPTRPIPESGWLVQQEALAMPRDDGSG